MSKSTEVIVTRWRSAAGAEFDTQAEADLHDARVEAEVAVKEGVMFNTAEFLRFMESSPDFARQIVEGQLRAFHASRARSTAETTK